jgi:methyl-accepting chemotaxis protein
MPDKQTETPDIADAVSELADSLETMSANLDEFSVAVSEVSDGYANFGNSTTDSHLLPEKADQQIHAETRSNTNPTASD